MVTRRSAIKAGAVLTGAMGTAGLVMPSPGSASEASDIDPNTVTKFICPMPLPRVLQPESSTYTTDYYTIRMKEARKEVLPGRWTTLRTFDGDFPGPVIKAQTGRRVVVRQINDLSVVTSIHLHGAHVPQSSDGWPMDTIAPGGGSKTYTYPNEQPHANLWFHDHAHHVESENVYRGLAATYLLTDDIEKGLNLPKGEFDVPISLRDAHFDHAAELVYTMGDRARECVVANGKTWPYYEVRARKYRFRLFNTSNMRFFSLKLSDGSSFAQIGSDGGLLAGPLQTTSLALSPGERADIVVDFSQYPRGTHLVLENGLAPTPDSPLAQVLQFRVTQSAPDSSTVPDTLRSLPTLPAPVSERSIVLQSDETGTDRHGYIDGKVFDPDRVDSEVQYGATEVWTVTNANENAPHNFHIHLVQFRVLERNGKPVTSGPESGLKDTVTVFPGEVVKIQATFTGYRGKYVYHCHMLDHSAMGMMATLQVV
ncbi:multicopper oxidase domain-containing protein [Streptomyces sp. N2-109]|uniref:Multicopper oxidase CueO n=1 Tax=Streptomyces gossypii TaxID=2883101 RepID=A0ABT2JMG0_9ACTN|nr:multicopper oxidase domain-containing protein [Streptomyces gossypii]MCT2588444.1 multicopper oxidase domain-containing protein [Streptomyces gossypii]